MITKHRLSDNALLGEVSPPAIEENSGGEELSREEMNSADEQSRDYIKQRRSSEKKVRLGLLASDDSCNAVDNTLADGDDGPQTRCRNSADGTDLSFNGKIKPLTKVPVQATISSSINAANDSETDQLPRTSPAGYEHCNMRSQEKMLNESFELLTKENSSLIHYKNEKSPDLFAEDDEDDEPENGSEVRNGDSGLEENDIVDIEYTGRTYDRNSTIGRKGQECVDNNTVDHADRKLLKCFQLSLAGIPPPPSMTYSDIDVKTMLTIYNANAQQWLAKHHAAESTHAEIGEQNYTGEKRTREYLNKPARSLKDLATIEWPELTKQRAHGLHYNRSPTTESIELLGLKYIERYISAETSSSFLMSHLQSSTKKQNQRLKILNQSPGRRLSHLAKRRATFSSESLLNNTCSRKGGTIVSAGKGAINLDVLKRLNPHRACNNRQVLLDPKKSDNRRKNKAMTPKRRTPTGKKSPRRRTPGSVTKKMSFLRANAGTKPSQPVHVPATRESSKRALFLSPQSGCGSSLVGRNERNNRSGCDSNSKQMERTIFSEARMLKSKRSLFSPPRGADGTPSLTTTSEMCRTGVSSALPTTTIGSVMSVKRSRSPTADCETGERTEKIQRLESSGLTEEDLTPRSLKFARSKSFCIGLHNSNEQTQTSVSESVTGIGGRKWFRANSEITSKDIVRPLLVLTDNQKQKLLWAVSQALQSKQITTKHELFKQHASSLARVVKRLFLEFNDQTTSSTSEKLLKLANKHVYDVMQGKSFEDIYSRERTRILNARNMPKLQGYIAPEEYELRKLKRAGSIASVSSFDGSSPFDCSLSVSQGLLSQSSVLSQTSSIGVLSQLSLTNSYSREGGPMKHVASTGSLNTLGLSSYLNSTALRENVDSELRQRSIKKQQAFYAKDQKNISPYGTEKNVGIMEGPMNGNKLLVGGALSSSIQKAKRQISFE